VNHVSIKQQLQQLAGEAAVPHSVVGCCEVDKHSSGLLFSQKAIFNVLCQQGDLVYGRPPVSKVRLLPRDQWVDMYLDSFLKILKGTHRTDMGRLLFGSPNGFPGLGITTINALLQIFGILSWRM